MKKHYRSEKNCLNCGKSIEYNFCSYCGQENLQLKESFWHIVTHSVGHYFHFDSKFLNSIVPLLIKPGYLTIQYNKGKRVSYLPPVSMYIFISIVFFFFSSLKNKKAEKENLEVRNEQADTIPAAKKEASLDQKDQQLLFDSVDSALAKKSDDEKESYWEKYLNKKRVEFGSESKRDAFNEALEHNIPKIMFILLPLFAVILKLVYFRKHAYYVEHLIYSIHFQSFVFLFLVVCYIIEFIIPKSAVVLDTLTVIFITWYLYKSLRNVYNSSRKSTIFKMLILSFSYVILLAISFAVVAAATALFY
ncbi:DUF3667 domain-containing protein [Rubrolithibacter danxiaensis]|uniref:DUF3667 domain-containing protein n=1 Tax=Rubrolithibacter danxiaensis TaxID=3390805 RepID=UPI003BF80210